jgi:pimeloyl-ACP methyl ester carboxylesterase
VDSFRRDGLTFDVRDAGPPDGEPVVLLHGFPQDSTAWDKVAPGLHASGLRTLAPDQRGYSPMARPHGRSQYRLRETVDDVLALLDAAGLQSAHVVGHDWGGAVAWGLGAWHPDRVRTLTAISVPHPGAMARAMVRSDQALRSYYMGLFQLPVLPERLILSGDGAALRRMLKRGGLPDTVAEHYVARMREPGALSAALAWYRALPWDGRDRVGTVRVPTLFVWSTGDTFLGRTAAEATGDFCAGPYRLVVLDDVTHWIPELAPDRVAELVTAHVRSA